MATTRPQINVRASSRQIAAWKDAANPAGSFNAWAVAALDAAARNGHPPAAASEPTTSARLLSPSELEEAEAGTIRESVLWDRDSPKVQKSRAGRCARRRFHRPGTYCKSCRTMTA